MKVQFYLRFHTTKGQEIHLSGNIGALGRMDPEKTLQMDYMNEEFWHATLELDSDHEWPISYKYILKNEDGSQVMEWGNDRRIDLSPSGLEEIQTVDTWNHAGEYENAFFSEPFQKTLIRHHDRPAKSKSRKAFTHAFRVKAPLLKKDQSICLIGSGPVLGEWSTETPQVLDLDGNWWTAKLNLPKETFPIHYKYGVFDERHNKFESFENGPDRLLYGDAQKKKICILHDGFVHLPNNTWRGAGVSLPVFSLKSKKSFGVGEFTDLKLLVDWAKKTGLRLIQILPVNDTSATHSWVDSYPYAAISAFALHPIYLNLEKVAGKKYAALLKPLKKQQKLLNHLADLDYEQVMKIKLAVIQELYAHQKQEWFTDKEYKSFFADHKHWLIPYAAFCCLRDKYGTADFSQWKEHNVYDEEAIEKFVSPTGKHFDSIAIQYFTQFHLHIQLRDATHYAHKHGVVIKGDIPIGIYRHSCDAWVEPKLYHLDMQAGAPPDDFAVSGQNWGFPTYNWEQMARDGFAWWKQRFEQLTSYFDAFRIDHILGFFRIWSIPMHEVEGIMGHFDPALPVHISEFHEKHIWFEHYRYTRPFINEAVLWEFFEKDSEQVKSTFLKADGHGFFELKDEFDNQRKIDEYFAALESNELNQRLRKGMMNVVSNVILFEVPDSHGLQFHFRIGMENTASFRYLDWNLQLQLRELYVNYFYHRQDHFWKAEAMKKLPQLKQATNMLVCGEDLGMVPHCVPDVMKQLGILSLEIQRMPKDPKREFFHPADAPYLSVVTPSTHDMSTIRGWWEEDRSKTQRFFNHELGQWGDAPFYCEPWINKSIVLQHLHSPAMWSIFQLQDLLGMSESIRRENPHDERINVPANPKNYWKFRMHISLENLLKEKEFNEEFRSYVHASDR